MPDRRTFLAAISGSLLITPGELPSQAANARDERTIMTNAQSPTPPVITNVPEQVAEGV